MVVDGSPAVPAWQQTGAWLLAIVVASSPAAAAAAAGGTLDNWIPVYVAGGLGGVVFELLERRWLLELPVVAPPSDDDGGDLGRLQHGIDLGFPGRFFSGGLGAVVVVMLLTAAAAEDDVATALRQASATDLSIAWGLAAGATTKGVWTAIQGLVERRVAALNQKVMGVAGSLDVAGTRLEQAARGLQPQTAAAVGAVGAPSPGAPAGDETALLLAEAIGAVEAAKAQLRPRTRP